MKRLVFTAKILLILFITLMAIYMKKRDFIKQIRTAYHYDTFNVFHWDNIRFTIAEPNKNFVKTQYIIHNPKKFNAFIFGSSRVLGIPPHLLPKEKDGTSLNWYNMTYSVGIPAEHLLTIKTFLRKRVDVKMIMIGFDNISMYTSIEHHYADLLRCPFQVYEKSKLDFFRPYLTTEVDPSIIKQIDEYDFETHKLQSEQFYSFDWWGGDFSLPENIDLSLYEAVYTDNILKDCYKDLEEIVDFCAENRIKLILFTNPMYQTLYRKTVEDGYLDFLQKVAQKCEFYDFSTLNNYTQNPRYYFESSHYRPSLGLIIEKYLFGTEEERSEIRREAGDELFGIKINSKNVDFVISQLKRQVQKAQSDNN